MRRSVSREGVVARIGKRRAPSFSGDDGDVPSKFSFFHGLRIPERHGPIGPVEGPVARNLIAGTLFCTARGPADLLRGKCILLATGLSR
jgi:hypothetical protein